jgi:cob(I)alamin adenosyltransferase
VIRDEHVTALEREIDGWNEALPPLRSFVLPGGGPVAAHLHLARTVCRRAERAVVRTAELESVRPEALRYLNRLSDALFVMSRHAARLYGEAEPLWEPERT